MYWPKLREEYLFTHEFKLVPQTAPWSYTQATDGDGQRQRYRAVQSDTRKQLQTKANGSTIELG